MNRTSKIRFIIIFVVLLGITIGMVTKLYFMQIVNGKDYLLQTVVNMSHSYEVEAIRGNIYDKNGKVLAYNVESHNLYINKSYKTTKELNASLLLLVNILENNNEVFVNHFKDYFEFENMQFNKFKTKEELYNWQTNKDFFNIKKEKIINDPKTFFIFLREFFEIDKKYTDNDAYKIMVLRYEILKNRWYWRSGDTLLVSKNICSDTLAIVSEKRHLLQGVTLRPSMTREYGDVVDVAQVLGYVGLVTPKDIVDKGYEADAIIGKTGIENYAEKLLKGSNGKVKVKTDTFGNIISTKGGTKTIDGNDIYLTIDMNLQKIAMDSLKHNIEIIKDKAEDNDKRNYADASAGSVVAIDVKTGKVLVMVSYPSYDPNWFIHDDEQSQKNLLKTLRDNIGKPMLNRAIQETYTPGSTFKPIVAIAGLEEGIITNETEILDTGHEVIGGWDFYCLEYVMSGGTFTHGLQNVVKAIETSCNMFFYKLGVATGIDFIDKWAKAFGLGEKTGIDLYGEAKGIRSNPEYKYSHEFEKWYIADTAQSSIGQLYHNYTPLQLANYTAALANGGKLFTPYIISKAINKKGEITYEGKTQYKQVNWSDDTFKTIRLAMANVVLDGTAEKVFDNYPINVAGKTGTAETGREANESSNGVFICYAPVEDPQIAIAVVIEHGVWGSYTAPVAKDILSEYFGLKYGD